MNKKIAVVMLVAFSLITTAWAADAGAQQGPGREQPLKALLAALKLTDVQKKDFSGIKLETEKRGIELGAKAQTAKLELRHLLMSDSPDQAAITQKMAEVAKLETDVRMNKIDGWFAANKLLTPDQQKVWLKALRVQTAKGMKDAKGMKGPRGMNNRHRRP